jgi:hypothetical protein
MLESNHEDNKPLSVTSDLTRLLRDIPAAKIGALSRTSGKLSPEWETIAVVARCASIVELWDTPVGTIQSYIPAKGSIHVDTLKGQWSLFKEDNSKDVMDYLQLLSQKPLDFHV